MLVIKTDIKDVLIKKSNRRIQKFLENSILRSLSRLFIRNLTKKLAKNLVVLYIKKNTNLKTG